MLGTGGEIRRKATILLVALGVATVWTVPALAVDDIVIPVDTVVTAAEGSVTELVSVPTNPDDVGQTCLVTVTAENNGSDHPGNDLIIASNGGQVVAEDVEREPGALTPASGLLSIGPIITVSLVMGPDEIFSGGLVAGYECVGEPAIAINKVTQDGGSPNDANPVIGETGDGITIPAGNVVRWLYEVTNPGGLPLENVLVTDIANPLPSPTPLPATQPAPDDAFNVGDINKDNLLDPGEAWQYFAEGLAEFNVCSHANAATADGTDEFGVTVSADDNSSYNVDCTGALGDTVWYDTNSDGVQDPGEPGIGGVNVRLFNIAGTAIATHSTGSDGRYPLFDNLPADDYTATVDVASANGLVPTTPTSINATILAGTVFLGADFGFVEAVEAEQAIDLALAKSVNPGSVGSFGSQAVFTVTVTHEPFTVAGLTQVDATGVVVGDVIPTGLTYVSDDTSGGAYNPTTGQWNVGNLAIGASKSFSFTVTVDGPSTSFTNTAEVFSAGQKDVDSTPNNNVPSEDDQDLATVVVVLQATPSSTTTVVASTLPVTGATSETPYLATIGALLLLLGGVLALSSRRWRHPRSGRHW